MRNGYKNFIYLYSNYNYLSSLCVVFSKSIPHIMEIRKSLPGIFSGFILCLTSLMVPSCTHDPVGVELLDTVCFDTQVMPILQNSCGSNGLKCHDGSTEGLNIYDTSSIMTLV